MDPSPRPHPSPVLSREKVYFSPMRVRETRDASGARRRCGFGGRARLEAVVPESDIYIWRERERDRERDRETEREKERERKRERERERERERD